MTDPEVTSAPATEEAVRLLRYLWTEADINDHKVRDMFGAGDPLTIDIERVLAEAER